MNELSTWQYYLIGAMLLNAGATVGGFLMLIKNHIKHINGDLGEIKNDIKTINRRCEDRGTRLARLEGRSED